MKNSRNTIAWSLAAIAALMTQACQPSPPKNSSNPLASTSKNSSNPPNTKNIYVEVGEPPESLMKRYSKAIDINDKNAGSEFYAMYWSRPNLGAVAVRNSASQVVFNNALGITGFYNEDYPEEGLSSYDLYLDLSDVGTILHDQARLKFYEMLGRLQKAGWQRCLFDTEPRLTGTESIRRLLETTTSVTTLDPSYVPTLAEWMSLDDQSTWRLYKDHVYMDVQLSRDPKHLAPELPGAYFVSISVESYTSKWRTLFDESDRPRWRELLLEEKQKASEEREKTERQLQTDGYQINTAYRNPDAEAIGTDAKAAAASSDKPASHP